MAKSLRKDLVAASKEKEGEDQVLWICLFFVLFFFATTQYST